MYAVSIVDDQRAHAERLRSLLEGGPHGAELVVRCFSDADELAAHLAAGGGVDIAFMDIVLSEDDAPGALGTGIDAAARLFPAGCGTQVVYVTGYDAFHTQAYRTAHASFLVKPVTQASVDLALDQALGRILDERERPLRVRVKDGERVVRPGDIAFAESRRHRVLLHTDDEVIEASGKLSDVERALPERFVRCHQSFLVNLDRVERLDAAEVLLSSGERVPISKNRRRQVRDALFAYVRMGW